MQISEPLVETKSPSPQQPGRRTDAAQLAESFRERYPEYPANAFEQLWLSRSASATYRAQIHPLFERIRTLGVAV